jgi:hypothetical protein
MSSSDIHYLTAKIREADLVRAAEHHRLVDEAVAVAKSRQAESRMPKGGGLRSHLRGVRRLRRAASPSAC